MANRFNTLQGNREDFQSLFVPMPLDAITNLAKDYSDRYKTGQSLPGKLDELAQKIQVAPVDYDNKQKWLTEKSKELEDLVSNAKETDWADYGFQRKIQSVINKAANDPVLNSFNINKSFWDKYQADKAQGDKNDLDFTFEHSNHPTTYKQNPYGQIISGAKITPYHNSFDIQSNLMAGIKESGINKDPYIDYSKATVSGDGFKVFDGKTQSYIGINETKVGQIAQGQVNAFAQSTAGKYRIQEYLKNIGFGNDAYDYDWNKLQNLASKNPVLKQIYDNLDKTFFEELYNTGARQIGGITTDEVKQDVIADPKSSKDKKPNVPFNGLSQTKDNTIQIKTFKNNIPDNIKKLFEEKDGKITVKTEDIKPELIRKIVNKDQNLKTPSGRNTITVENKVSEQQIKLAETIINMANAIGIEPTKMSSFGTQVDPDTNEIIKVGYDDIATEYYNNLKQLLPEEIIEGVDKARVQNQVITGKNNYLFKDADDDKNPIIDNRKIPLFDDKNFQISNRSYNDGEMFYKGTYTDSNGEVKNYNIYPTSKQEIAAYKPVTDIQKSTQTFFEKGEILEDNKLKIKNFNEFTNTASTQIPNISNKVINNISQIPGKPDLILVSYGNPKKRNDVDFKIIQIGSKKESPDRLDIIGYDNIEGGLDGLIQFMSGQWYNTLESTPGLEYLLPQLKQFESKKGE